MTKVSELVSQNVGNAIINSQTWGSLIYNVKNPAYGAKGDGVTDDTIAIQAAINACGIAGGGIVRLPPGGYLISATLINIYNNVIIEGSGFESTYFLTNLNITMLRLGVYDFPTKPNFDTTDYRYFNQVKGIMFLSRYTGASPNIIGIELKGMCLSRIENCRFADTTTGIRVRALSQNNVFEKNTFGGTGKLVNCIDIFGEGSTANHNSTGNIYSHNHFLAGTVGINMSGNTFGDMVIEGNIFISVTNAIKAVSPVSGALYAAKIGVYNNDFDGLITYALYMEICNHSNFNDNNVAPNITGGIGVFLKGCTFCHIQNNKITHGSTGIQIIDGGNHSISDNQTLTQVLNALILTNSTNSKISDNIFRSTNDTVTIQTGSLSNRFNHNILIPSSGNKITTFANDYSNLFINENGDIFYLFGAANQAGFSRQIARVNAVTSTTVYTNLMRIDIPQFSAAKLTLVFALLVTGGGSASQVTDVLLKRDGGNVSTVTLSNNVQGIVFDIQYDVATTPGSALIGIKRNGASAGTQIDGTLVAEAIGVLATSIINL